MNDFFVEVKNTDGSWTRLGVSFEYQDQAIAAAQSTGLEARVVAPWDIIWEGGSYRSQYNMEDENEGS